MFGTYQYGSELLNVTFDPTVAGEVASYGYDDDGTPAERTHLIKDGVLQRPMGGHDLAGPGRARRCGQQQGLELETVRRSTAWRTSTSKPAIPPSMS